MQAGDTPETGYVLKLPEPICLTGNTVDLGGSGQSFSEVELVPAGRSVAALMRQMRGVKVSVTLTDQAAGITGHHHRPLVAKVTDVSSLDPAPDEYDLLAEEGTPATTIRAFYAALSMGEGALASQAILPSRRTGALSGDQLTLFFGSLYEPLTLLGLRKISRSRYVARYSYEKADGAGRCDGASTLTVDEVGGRIYISAIAALNGC